jgi:uncharacterized protein YukE
METLQQVMEMQAQGFSDEEIYQRLRNMGVSPREIQDSVNQARVKNAVYSQENPIRKMPPLPQSQSPINQMIPSYEEPQGESGQEYQNQVYPTQEAPQYPGNENYMPQEQPLMPEYQENYYPPAPQSYQDQNYYVPPGNVSSDSISEIAEQVVSEKIIEFKKEVGDFGLFQSKISDKVADIDERLRRIENSIDKLQQAIIGRIGEFGDNTAMIHKDLNNLHGTVSKLVNPLMDNYKELQKLTKK